MRLTSRTLITGAAVVALAPFLSVGAAQASTLVGQDPVTSGCADDAYTVDPPPDRSSNGSLIVRDRSSMWAGNVRVLHSRYCGTAWVEYDAFDDFGGEVSVWNSRNQSQKAWVEPGDWARTAMVDDVPGITTCVGTQVYLNDRWRNWDMGFCW